MTESEKLAITKYDLLYEQRMTTVESSIGRLDKTMENLNESVKDLKAEIRLLRSEFKSDFRWLFGLIILLFGIMAHGFKWF